MEQQEWTTQWTLHDPRSLLSVLSVLSSHAHGEIVQGLEKKRA